MTPDSSPISGFLRKLAPRRIPRPAIPFVVLAAALILAEAGFAVGGSLVRSRFEATLPRRTEEALDRVRRLFHTREATAARGVRALAGEISRTGRLPAPDEFGRIELFRTLASVTLPADVAGAAVRNGSGTPVAWRGRSYGVPDGLPSAPRSGVLRSAVYRVLYVEVPVLEDGAVVGSVLAWSPFDLNYPLHNRYLRRGDFETEVAERLGLRRVVVTAPGAAPEEAGENPLRHAGPLEGLSGDTIARITVEVFPAEVHAARLLHVGRGVRAVLVLLLLLMATVAAGRAALDRSPIGLPVFLLVLVLARVGIYLVGFPRLVFSGPAFDPAQFSYPVEAFGFSLGMLHSPADLVLTMLAVLGAVGITVVVLARRIVPRLPDRPRPVAGLAVALGAGLFATGLAAVWLRLVHLLPYYSTVEFFSEQTVLPDWPAGLLLLGVFIAAVAMFLGAAFAFALAARLLAPRRSALLSLLSVLPLLPAFYLARDLSLAVSAVAAVSVAAASALAVSWRSLGLGLRVAAMTALVTLAAYAPFQDEVWKEVRADVEDEAEAILDPAKASPLRHRLQASLGDLAGNPRLVRLLTEDPDEPRPQLAFRLWAESPLARRPRGADIEILDCTRKRVLSRFDIDMPPREWLPDSLPGAAVEQQIVTERPGLMGGERQDFLVGTAPIHSLSGELLGQLVVRVPVERPILAPTTRPEILSSYEEEPLAGEIRELQYAEYDGDRLVSTTNPEYPRLHRAPPQVVAAVIEEGRSGFWTREQIGGKYWINYYRPRVTDGEVTGMTSVGFESKQTSDLFLAFFKMLLVNSMAALGAGALLALARVRSFVPKFQHKLLLSYLVISVVPVVLLAELNRGIARETVEEQMRETLRESIRLVRGELRDRAALSGLDYVVEPGVSREMVRAVVDDERLKEIGYRLGQEVNLFVRGVDGEWGAPLVASSEPGIFTTELFSDRLAGDAYLQTILLGREFYTSRDSVGEYSYLVGYSPLPDAEGRPLGAISLPMIYGQDAVNRELARRNSLIIAAYLLILLLVLFFGMVLARRISSPIERLVEGTRRLSAGDLTYRIPYRPRDEFGYLVDSFNRMTEDLEQSREKIVKAEKDAAWREMAKQIAHEIKNPLTPMRLSAQHILRAYTDRHEEFEEILERGVETIIRQVETLRRIAGEFSSFARLPTRRLVVVDPGEMAREVAGLYAGTKGVEIVEEIDEVPGVRADRDELKRVLVNLATNAVQAMEGAGGVLTIRTAKVRTRYGGEALELVEISVADTGVGIPPGDLGKLFQPNFSTKTGGTGLGLAISKAVVESFGGDIAVASEPGVGTTVTVQFPPAEEGGA